LSHMVATPPFTRTDYDRLPEDLRVELIDGQLLKMPSPTMFHQELVLTIADALRAVAKPKTVYVGPVDFGIDEHNVLVPDVVALKQPVPRDAKGIRHALVVVEILSPSTARRDRKVKADKYLAAGAEEIWLVDPAGKTIEVRRSNEAKTFADAERATSVALSGFELVCDRIF